MAAITAENVREFFRDLGIVVCDDSALIADRVKVRRRYYVVLNCRCDPMRQLRAKEWMQLVSKATRKLPELLQLVYEDFEYEAKCSVAASDGRSVDGALVDVLADLAKRTCLWEDTKLERPPSSQMYKDWAHRFLEPEHHSSCAGQSPVETDFAREAPLGLEEAEGSVPESMAYQ